MAVKFSALLLFAALLLAQAMPVAQVSGASTECQLGCCAPKHCGCCVANDDTKKSEPIVPPTNDSPAPKAIPFATSLLTRLGLTPVETARSAWRAIVELSSAGDVPLSVLHCSFLI